MALVRAPKIGEMRDRVDLQSRVDAGNAMHGVDTTYVSIAEVWARVVMESGGIIVEGRQEARAATHRVTIRKRDDKWNSVLWNGIRLRIISMAHDDTRQFTEMMCEAEDGL